MTLLIVIYLGADICMCFGDVATRLAEKRLISNVVDAFCCSEWMSKLVSKLDNSYRDIDASWVSTMPQKDCIQLYFHLRCEVPVVRKKKG